ncbi:MAG: hypothetical protein ACKORI_05930 [Verrucomicrobiota bacterium]
MPYLQKIFLRLPYFLRQAAIDLNGRRQRDSRYSAGFKWALRRAEERADWPSWRLQDYAARRLSEHLKLARHSPFWAELFQERCVNPEASDPFAELAKFPVLSKETVRANLGRIASPLFRKSELLSVSTSGTTGSGMTFPETKESEWERWATWWRYRRRLGIGLDKTCALFGGRPIVPIHCEEGPFWHRRAGINQVLFSSYHVNACNVRAYVDEIRRSGAGWIHGYPSTIALLASLMTEASIPPPECVQIITTGAENLTDAMRSKIAKAFGVPVRQHYCLAESTANFSEDPTACMHVDEDFSCVELPQMGDIRSIIGTNWHNPAFPLFRYDSGDICNAESTTPTFPEYTGQRTIQGVDGRLEDNLLMSDGTRIGRLDQIFKSADRIRMAQILQTNPGFAEFKIVRGYGYGKSDEAKLRSEIENHIGGKCRFEIVYVDDLPRTARGKLRAVVSRTPPSP